MFSESLSSDTDDYFDKFEEVVDDVVHAELEHSKMMQGYQFKKYKLKVYDLVLQFFHTHYGSWDLMDFPNIDEFVHKAWAMNKYADKDTVFMLMDQQFTTDRDYE